MRVLVGHGLLACLFIVVGAVAACGGGETPPSTVPTSTPTAPSTAPSGTGSSATSPVPTTSGTSPAGTGTSTPSAPPNKGPMNPPHATGMAADLAALGLDAKKLPPLNKIEPEKLRQVMKTFTKSLGTQCTGCHDANDFKAATPNKKVASKMWDAFARGLSMEDGSALYCDSCHQGHMEFLDRTDKKALGKWMDTNYVSKLKRLDKKDHGCETCHGDPFDPKFLTAWSK